MIIRLDTREPEDINLMLKNRGFSVKREALPAGDICIGAFLIERKTISDFYSSIVSKRIWAQLEDLKAQVEMDKAIVVIGGFENIRNVSPYKSISIVMSVIATIISSFKIPVLFLKDDYMLMELIEALARLYSGTKPSFRPVVKKKAKNDFEVLENCLCQFPMVGITKAKTLLKAYGSITNLLSSEEIKTPKLKKEIENIRRLANLEYKV